MERLTIESTLNDGYTLKSMCSFDSNSSIQDEEEVCTEQCEMLEGWGCEECLVKKAFDRLAAYEDTGLTPEEIKTLKADNITLQKIKNAHFFVLNENNGFYMINDDWLDIHICEKSQSEAVKSLNQELRFIYEAYVKENDNNLSSGAKDLKRKFENLMRPMCEDINERSKSNEQHNA